MSFVKEFKDFAVKGNVMDMAVGVIIGGAFGKIVSSLVNDIIMPLIGILTGGIDFKDISIQVGSATVKYGLFLQNVTDFFIIAICIFIMIKAMNSLSKKKEEKPAGPTEEQKLLGEIRDLLKNK